jgi:DNA-binding NtrC family response regulator
MSIGAADAATVRHVWIVEDEPEAAALAAELCVSSNSDPLVFRTALPFLVALRSSPAPDAVILDWRLERELSAALFLATRHRYPSMPVVYWTGTTDALPATVRQDRSTRIVDKADGVDAFERAVAWALEAAVADPDADAADG